MHTTAVSRPARPQAQGAYDRAFYTGMAITMAATVFAGFASTFYLRPLFGAPVTITGAVTLSPLAVIHGTVFSAWVLLFVLQTSLVATKRVALHRKMGVAGAVLAAAMVTVGVPTAIASAAAGRGAPGADPMEFLVVPIVDMLLFPAFVVAALLWRRDREAHKRLMLLAYLSIITAAIARLPGIITLGPPVFFGLTLLFVVVGMIYDYASRGRVHPVYIWGGAILALSVPVRLAIAGTAAWRAVAEFLVG